MDQADPLVIFTPSGKRGRVPRGTTVLAAARLLGVDLDSVCGGRGICSKCQVAPGEGSFPKFGITVASDALTPVNDVEKRYDRVRGLAEGRRLGCQAQVMDDLVVDVPPESQVHRQVVRKAADARPVYMAPASVLRFVAVEDADMHAPTGDLERVAAALATAHGIEAIDMPATLLPALQPALEKGGREITLALHRDHRDTAHRVLGIWPGYLDGPLFGLAIDLGSTTIAAHLTDLTDGRVVAAAGRMNPQIRYGEDLMSRVSYAMMNEGGAARMTAAVRDALGELAVELAAEAGIASDRVVELVVVCNPVMHHLLLGIDPAPLGQAPFPLTVSGAVRTGVRELGLAGVADEARVYVLPCIAGHVGADAAGVALAERPYASDDLVLVCDVGTNAEILLGRKGRVLACSSPTGPAFEGAQISAGQRAAPGAIERVEIDPATKEPRFRVIGCDLWSDDPDFARATAATGVTGICGSGIIEALAEMRIAGVMDASGLIGSAAQTGSDRCIADGRTHAYVLHDAREVGGALISVTQGDVRAIQLAKSALYAGARLLMDEMGVDTVDRVVLAGAFGAHISPRHALVLGMFPDVSLDRVASAGNAAGTGARIALCDVTARAQIEDEVRRIVKVETAVEPRFQEHFVAASAIPHATAPFDRLRAAVPLPDVVFGAAGGEGRRRRRGA